MPPASLFGLPLETSFRLYWLIVPVTLLMLLGASNLFRTRIGRPCGATSGHWPGTY